METYRSNAARRRGPTLHYNNDSGQGDAMAEIFGVAKHFIGMTGSLINGYANGIFHLLYRVASHLMQADNMPYESPNKFSYEYGVVQYITRTEEAEYAANRRATTTSSITKQLPGVSPLVFARFLMEQTAFLTLKDLGKALPDYEEIPVPMALEPEIQSEYKHLEDVLRKVLKHDRRIARKVQPAFFNLLIAYPDQSYSHRTIYDPRSKEPLVEPAELGCLEDLRPKDRFVLEKVHEKTAAGGRVVIYTSWVRLDTQKKLAGLLREQGYNVQILPPTVPTEKREAWVAKKVREGVQVLICNPTLVATGLDLLAFTTYIYYDLGNKLFDLRQSSRRGYRINQEEPGIEVYLLYYEGTTQQNMMKLMASKLAAANMIEGGYSEDGLAAMSETEDTSTLLARELMLGIRSSVEDIGAAFKKMAILNPISDAPVQEAVKQDDIGSTPTTIDSVVITEPVALRSALSPDVVEVVRHGRVYTEQEISEFLASNKKKPKKVVVLEEQCSMFETAS